MCINIYTKFIIYFHWFFLVKSLGCWGEAESDRAITEDYGELDTQGCYEKTLSLGYRVFAINEGSNCYTSESAFKTYTKYGPISCDDPRASIVYQINSGN